jgi:adenosylcobinamide-phosphate synthase
LIVSRAAIDALITDLIAGELPEHLHPTVFMGKWIARSRSRRVARTNFASLAEGALVVGSGIAIAAIAAATADKIVRRAPRSARRIARGLALKPALSLRPLIAAARRVQFALDDGELTRARQLLSRDLVSRDTSQLSEDEVAGAAIESVAENLSDSVVAPLLAFRVGGLSAAYAYRFINTADAMLGYHTEELEWFGKSAARADDVVNFIPARITAALICVTAGSASGSPSHAARVALLDAKRTLSPNAGWPMAAMAGALDVCLTKRGQYELNAGGYPPIPRDIARACRIALAVSAVAGVLIDVL